MATRCRAGCPTPRPGATGAGQASVSSAAAHGQVDPQLARMNGGRRWLFGISTRRDAVKWSSAYPSGDRAHRARGAGRAGRSHTDLGTTVGRGGVRPHIATPGPQETSITGSGFPLRAVVLARAEGRRWWRGTGGTGGTALLFLPLRLYLWRREASAEAQRGQPAETPAREVVRQPGGGFVEAVGIHHSLQTRWARHGTTGATP